MSQIHLPLYSWLDGVRSKILPGEKKIAFMGIRMNLVGSLIVDLICINNNKERCWERRTWLRHHPPWIQYFFKKKTSYRDLKLFIIIPLHTIKSITLKHPNITNLCLLIFYSLVSLSSWSQAFFHVKYNHFECLNSKSNKICGLKGDDQLS